MKKLWGCLVVAVLFTSVFPARATDNVSPVVTHATHLTKTAASEHDVEARSLTIPVYVQGGKMTLVQSAVKNVGQNTESFSVEFGRIEWDGAFTVHRTRTVSDLPPGESANVSFGLFSFPKNIEYKYFVRVVLDGDMNPDNDVAFQAVNSFTTMRDLVLIEKATGTWCVFCPGSAVCVDSLFQRYPGQVAAIEYHGGDAYENPQGRERIRFYGVRGYPTAIFNGISEIVGGSSAFNIDDLWPQYKGKVLTALSHHGTCLQMETTYTETDGHIKAVTKLTGVATSYVRSFRLFYAVTESHIYERWGGLDSLQHVFRAMHPDLDGIAIVGETPIQEGWSFDDEIEFDLPAGAVRENCEIIAFVQNMDNKVIMAAAVAEKQAVEPPVIAVAAADTLRLQGVPGEEFVTAGKIYNLTDQPQPVRLQRVAGVMPDDWSSSICIEYCLAPWVDVVDDTIAANDSLDFSLHLFAGATPDSGDVALKISPLADSSAVEGVNVFWVTLFGKTGWPQSVDRDAKEPLSFRLVGAYPNPFNPGTTIEYSAAQQCQSAVLQVYSVRGRLVAEKRLSGLSAGVHHVNFDGGSLAGGVYLYRIVY